MSFKINEGKGFQITFNNGNTISVQFGPGCYCEHYNSSIIEFYKNMRNSHVSKDAEVAVFNSNGEWYDFDSGEFKNKTDIKGYVDSQSLLEILNRIATKQ